MASAAPPLSNLAGRLKPVVIKRAGLALALWGNAGIGKSYHINQLLQNLSCRSLSLHATTPLDTFAKSLPTPTSLAPWANHSLLSLIKGETLETTKVINTLSAILAGLAPFVLHLEDIHESNQERLEFIQALARRVSHIKGVGLIVSSRTVPPEPFVAMSLEALNQDQSNTLLEKEMAAHLPSEALEWIYDKALGNPLYTLEYLRYLSRQGILWNDGKHWHWRKPESLLIPVTVEALIELLLTEVLTHPSLERVLQTKAYLPLDINDTISATMSGLPLAELELIKLELMRQGIFDNHSFAHPLYREIIRKKLPKPQQRFLARKSLEVLQDDPIQATAFIEDADLESAKILELLQQATFQATNIGNEAQAARFRARTIDYIQGHERSQLAFEAATELYAYDLSEAIRLLKLAHQSQPDDFNILSRLVAYLAQNGNRNEVEHLLKTLSTNEQNHHHRLMLEITIFHYLQEPSQVLKLWDAHPEIHPYATPTTIRNVAFSKADLGDTQEALDLANETLKGQLSIEERALLLEACGFACYTKSDFNSAVTYYSQAIQHFNDHAQHHRTGSLLFNRAIALQNLARFSESLLDAEQARQIAARGGHSLFYSNAQLALGLAHLEHGHYELAEELLLECESYYRHSEMTGWLVDTYNSLSDLYCQWKAPHARILATKHAHSALALARTLDNPRFVLDTLPYTIVAEALFGKAQSALELAHEADHLDSRQDNLVRKARILRGCALAHKSLTQPQEALCELKKALAIIQPLGLELDTAKICLELAHLTHDLEEAKKISFWFEKHNLINGVHLAQNYFPELADLPSSDPSSKPTLCLNVLGIMEISQHQQITTIRGRKRQEFLALLLESRLSGRSEISKLTLLDLLYPNQDELKALQNLKTLIHSLRSSFGEALIQTTSTGYRLGNIHSDAETFLETADVSLWHGLYLDGIETGLNTVQETLYHALYEKATMLLERDSKEVARVTEFLLNYDPYNENYLYLALQALQRTKNYRSLGKRYNQAKTHFSDIGNPLPQTWTLFLEQQAKSP